MLQVGRSETIIATGGRSERHTPLSRERVLRAAVALADEAGVAALTMRRLGDTLGVEAMSLYKHVANKDDILGGIIDLVVDEIELPRPEDDWRTATRRRAISARTAFSRHPWAITVLESRASPGPAMLRYYESTLAALRRDGFSVELAAHAGALVDSYVYGFAVQEATLPFDTSDEMAAITRAAVDLLLADEHPYMREMALEHVLQPGYDFANEFEYGLDLILDALERRREPGSGVTQG